MKNCHIFIKGNNNTIIIADNVKAIGAEFWIEDDKNTINIDQGTYIAGKTHFACTEGQSISVGKKCLFSTDVVIRTGDSHSIIDDTGKRINPALPVTIGNHVWVGNKVTICKGSTIPDNCIVGTSCVVTKQIKDSNSVIVGIPGRVIKRDVNWDIRRLPFSVRRAN